MSVTQKFSTRDEPAAATRPCLAQALRLLNRKPMSAQDLTERLTSDGYDPEAIAAALEQMRTWGYINDARLGDATVASAVRRKKGPAWLKDQLRRRGIDHAIVTESVAAIQHEAPALAIEILRSRFGAAALNESRTVLRAMRLLQRRGFDGACIRQALKAVAQEAVSSDLLDTMDDDSA
jgi:regulatory protein